MKKSKEQKIEEIEAKLPKFKEGSKYKELAQKKKEEIKKEGK